MLGNSSLHLLGRPGSRNSLPRGDDLLKDTCWWYLLVGIFLLSTQVFWTLLFGISPDMQFLGSLFCLSQYSAQCCAQVDLSKQDTILAEDKHTKQESWMQMSGDPHGAPAYPAWGSAHKTECWAFCLAAPERGRGKAVPEHPLNRCIESLDKKWVWSWQMLCPVAWKEWEGWPGSIFSVCAFATGCKSFGFVSRTRNPWVLVCLLRAPWDSAPGRRWRADKNDYWMKQNHLCEDRRTVWRFSACDNKVGAITSSFYRNIPAHSPHPILSLLRSHLCVVVWAHLLGFFSLQVSV